MKASEKENIMKNTEKKTAQSAVLDHPKKTSREKILGLVQLAFLAALIIVLQFFVPNIVIPGLPKLSFVLVPIVIGACLLGEKSGAILGFVFGLITIIMGVTGMEPFSLVLFEEKPVWFIVLCLAKATAAGYCAGLVYKALGKAFHGKYKTIQTILASITAPVVNTGIFAVGMLLCFLDTMNAKWAFGGYSNPLLFVLLGLAGWNFVVEFAINLVLSPAIVRIIDVVKKKLHF